MNSRNFTHSYKHRHNQPFFMYYHYNSSDRINRVKDDPLIFGKEEAISDQCIPIHQILEQGLIKTDTNIINDSADKKKIVSLKTTQQQADYILADEKERTPAKEFEVYSVLELDLTK